MESSVLPKETWAGKQGTEPMTFWWSQMSKPTSTGSSQCWRAAGPKISKLLVFATLFRTTGEGIDKDQLVNHEFNGLVAQPLLHHRGTAQLAYQSGQYHTPFYHSLVTKTLRSLNSFKGIESLALHVFPGQNCGFRFGGTESHSSIITFCGRPLKWALKGLLQWCWRATLSAISTDITLWCGGCMLGYCHGDVKVSYFHNHYVQQTYHIKKMCNFFV